jgi:UDP-N-acetylglucosamine 2-epimerase (non-hydrolysing)
MFLVCFGTRPEIIKMYPLIEEFKNNNIPFKTLFTGQHKDLSKQFLKLSGKPNFTLNSVMEHNQSLSQLFSKILSKSDLIFKKDNFKIIVQGDALSSVATAMSAFYNQKDIIHLEAGLRTYNLSSPYPEEANRVMISHLANIHFCPTRRAKDNLVKEGVKKNIYLVGNTIVDSFSLISSKFEISENILKTVDKNQSYILVTLHRRENKERNFNSIWNQLNSLSKELRIIYIKHPSVRNAETKLNKKIKILEPVNYPDMLYLIKHSSGIISDSGGLQEEVVCANKKILICRDSTERPETIEYGYGKLIGTKIEQNINFLFKNSDRGKVKNPYGINVSNKIVKHLEKLYI